MDVTAETRTSGASELVYRYERKYLVEGRSPAQVAALIRLHPRLFREPYPPRYVNNLYLDTADMTHYREHVNGASRRKKVRIRWYGESEGEIARPTLEIKVKEGPVGTKLSYPLVPFRLVPGWCDRDLVHTLAVSELPDRARAELAHLRVVLYNRYRRRYYASCDGRFRLTLDSALTYARPGGACGGILRQRTEGERALILELKYDVPFESEAYHVARHLSFHVTHASKYIAGVERLYG